MFISTRDADHSAARRSAPLRLLIAAAIAGSFSCKALDPGDDTCITVTDCFDGIEAPDNGDAGGETPPLWEQDPTRWGCLNPANPPVPPVPTTPAVNLTAAVLDYATLMPMPGLTMKFCLSMDAACDVAPQAVPVPNMPPLITLQIPAGFEGYLRQEAPNHVIQDYFLLAPMLEDDSSQAGRDSVFTLVSDTSIAGFIGDIGIQVNPMLGILAFYVSDCAGKRVEGVRLTLPELATRPDLRSVSAWAINNRLPVLGVATDKDGTAGFVNVPTGTLAVEASIGGQTFGLTRMRVLGGRLTAGTIRPLYLSGR